MMNIRELIQRYQQEGLSMELAEYRVCQDIVLKAIADGPLNRNVTIKGGVVMRSITKNLRRATRDIDLDFIHTSISDDSVSDFVKKLNCIDGVTISIDGPIQELKHQDYHGKCVNVVITDIQGMSVKSKIDIGVHKRLEINQDEYCFDVCFSDEGASLLKNTVEQAFTEKLRSLLIFAYNSRRYKDIYDMYYLKDVMDIDKLHEAIEVYIFNDKEMRENTMSDIVNRVQAAFKDKQYLKRVDGSRQRWIDEDIQMIAEGIIAYLMTL